MLPLLKSTILLEHFKIAALIAVSLGSRIVVANDTSTNTSLATYVLTVLPAKSAGGASAVVFAIYGGDHETFA